MSRLAILLSLAVSAAASAQGQAIAPARSSLYAAGTPGPLDPAPGKLLADTAVRRIRTTYWREGALIGGSGLGTFAAYLSYGLCSQFDTGSEDCTTSLLGGFIMGGAVGVAVGSLIGGQFPKGRTNRSGKAGVASRKGSQ